MLRTPTLPASPRPRGAQPGNTNALKYGFYSPRFREKDLTDLEGHTFDGLADEILMLRVFMRRVMEFTGEVTTLDRAMELMRVLSLSSMAIARLSRIQSLFPHDDDNDFAHLLNATIDEVLTEIRAEDAAAQDKDSSDPDDDSIPPYARQSHSAASAPVPASPPPAATAAVTPAPTPTTAPTSAPITPAAAVPILSAAPTSAQNPTASLAETPAHAGNSPAPRVSPSLPLRPSAALLPSISRAFHVAASSPFV